MRVTIPRCFAFNTSKHSYRRARKLKKNAKKSKKVEELLECLDLGPIPEQISILLEHHTHNGCFSIAHKIASERSEL